MEVITLEIRTTANISGFCLTCALFVENHSKLGCTVHATTQPVFQRTCRVCWCDLFTGQMSRNQHCQSTEGRIYVNCNACFKSSKLTYE